MALHEERRQPSLESQGGSKDATAKVTLCVLLSCICAASGGFMVGYDMVIAGGIGIMDGFLEKFYPMVFEEKKRTKQDVYCKYNNEVFQLFSSSLYLGALLTTFVASFVSRKFGRKSSMLIAGVLFICGTLLCTLAINISMILSGRTLVGFGIGFSNQVVVGLIFALSFTNSTQRQEIGHIEGIALVVTLSIFTLAFAGSLGPLAWLIPSEIFSLEVRSLGLSVATIVNMLFKFIIAQTFLSMLCALEYGTFILCSCFSLLLMIFVALFLPETKGLSLHAMQEVWESHWFWKRFINNTKHSDGLRGTSESHNIH